MTHHLALSDRDVRLILVGLQAISPSGGGSDPFTLMREISGQTGLGQHITDSKEWQGYYNTPYDELLNHLNESGKEALADELASTLCSMEPDQHRAKSVKDLLGEAIKMLGGGTYTSSYEGEILDRLTSAQSKLGG